MSTIKKEEQSPFKIWGAIGGLVGGVYQGIQAGKAAKKAEAAEAEAKKNQKEMQDYFMSMDISNPFKGMQNAYAGLENKMEDLTINKKEAEFASQQFAQSQSNIMSGLRGAAGGSGIAALAQSLAQQGQIAAQKSAAGIGQQEAANQRTTAQEASNLQLKEASGEAEVATRIASGEQAAQQLDMTRRKTLMDAANQEYQNAQGTAAAAQAQKDKAIGGAISGGFNLLGGILSDKRLKKNIKLISKSPSGLKIYAFEYIDKFFGEHTYQGVMSDEIPNSAVINNGSYDRVDYSKIDVEFKIL
jgi:hypothetical protein